MCAIRGEPGRTRRYLDALASLEGMTGYDFPAYTNDEPPRIIWSGAYLKTMTDPILHCKILCFDRAQKDLLGKADDLWANFAIDLRDVFAVREMSDPDDDGCCYVHTSDGEYQIDQPYNKVRNLWTKIKNGA